MTALISVLVAVLVAVYLSGVLAVGGYGVLEWSMSRSLIRDHQAGMDELDTDDARAQYDKEQLDEYRRDSVEAARIVMRAPTWPLTALSALMALIHDARQPVDEPRERD